MGVGAAALVSPPRAVPRRYGLIDSATVLEADGPWENGFTFAPTLCGESTGTADPCVSTAKNSETNPEIIKIEPFVAWAADACTPMQARDYEAIARQRLLSCQGKIVESEFWRGDQAITSGWTDNQRLASLASDVVTSSPATPLEALECLEQAAAECGCTRAMIHATPQTVIAWAAQQLVRREGGLILTVLDSIVVAGAGYDGSGPPGIANGPPTDPMAGSIWAYATGIVEVRLGSIEVFPKTRDQALDRSLNLVTYRAERPAAASWDGCCLAAAEINLPLCGIGGAGS